MTKIRVLQMNSHGGANAAGVLVLGEQAEFIKALSPDFVMLQEVERDTRRSTRVDQADQLAVMTGLRNYAYGPMQADDDGYVGNAVLSKFPLTDVVSTIVPKAFYMDTGNCGHVAATALVDGNPYRLISTHLSYRRTDYRQLQLNALADTIHGLWPSIHPIIGGDFNNDPSDADCATLRVWMNEAHRVLYPDWSNAPTIDQVWFENQGMPLIETYENPSALQFTDHESVTVVTVVFGSLLRDVDWQEIGHANNVVAMTTTAAKLFAATSDNQLWWRDPVGTNVNWELIGHANDVVGMAANDGKLFAATRDRQLWWRDPVGTNVDWQPIGHANDIAAMTAIYGKLFAATTDNRLWWRDPVGTNVDWQPIGHANDVVAMTATNGKLFAATKDRQLWWRYPVGTNVDWQPIGQANDIAAMTAIYGKLFAATTDNRLWWRESIG